MTQVFNRDCMEAMKEFPDKFFDVIITDPPYGVDLEYGLYKDSEANWYDLMHKFIPEAIRVSKMVIMPSCRIKALPWIYQNYPPDWLICWYKGSPGHVSYVGFNDWEPLLVYGKSHSKLSMHDYFQMRNDVKMGSFDHPCPKPVKWFQYLMQRTVPDGGKVADCFLGSGSSRIAADSMGFDFWGYELDKEYFDASCKRFDQYKAQLNLF